MIIIINYPVIVYEFCIMFLNFTSPILWVVIHYQRLIVISWMNELWVWMWSASSLVKRVVPAYRQEAPDIFKSNLENGKGQVSR